MAETKNEIAKTGQPAKKRPQRPDAAKAKRPTGAKAKQPAKQPAKPKPNGVASAPKPQKRRRGSRQQRTRIFMGTLLVFLAGMLAVCVLVGSLVVRGCTAERVDRQQWHSMARDVAYSYARVDRAFRRKPTIACRIEAASLLNKLSTEQQVAQLFFVTPESLVAGRHEGTVTGAGDATREALAERPVGGIIYFQQNLLDASQTKTMLDETKRYALEACGIPILLDVDEEGGTVSRVGGNPGFAIENVGNMSDVGATQDVEYAGQVGHTIGAYLHELGFTSDFAPVADIANNPSSDTMYWRSFGSDPDLVGQMVAAQVRALRSQRIISCAKHFPGIGGAEGDSHYDAIYSNKSADEMASEELVPFAAAIEAGVPMVMVGHLSCPTITGNELPASLSPAIMRDMLRDRLGFKGVVVTDSLSMGAVNDRYTADRVGVEAFLAGADALLMPADFDAAYQGMLDAVASGEISQERLRASAYRIIYMKLQNEH